VPTPFFPQIAGEESDPLAQSGNSVIKLASHYYPSFALCDGPEMLDHLKEQGQSVIDVFKLALKLANPKIAFSFLGATSISSSQGIYFNINVRRRFSFGAFRAWASVLNLHSTESKELIGVGPDRDAAKSLVGWNVIYLTVVFLVDKSRVMYWRSTTATRWISRRPDYSWITAF